MPGVWLGHGVEGPWAWAIRRLIVFTLGENNRDEGGGVSYATKAGKKEWARRYRASKLRAGICLQCSRQSTGGRYCATHAATSRLRSKLWMQARHGYQPREAFMFHDAKTRMYWEEIGGWWTRVLVDWRDPLSVLLRAEEEGDWTWRAAS